VTRTEPVRLPESPDLDGAFPRLSERQLQALAAHGVRRRMQQGEVLYQEGDERCDFFVILEGQVAILEGHGGAVRVIAVHGPRRFLGELGLLTGQAAFLTAVALEPGEVLVVPVDRLRELVSQDSELGDLVLRAYLIRRSLLIELGAGFRIVGSRYSPDTRRLREFAARNRLPHRWIDLEKDKDAEALLRELGITPEETPVVIWRGEQVLHNPTNAELARVIGLPLPRPGGAVCDLVIVGAGPAGLAAAVYAASEGLATVALDAVATGGQAGTAPRIENYPGFRRDPRLGAGGANRHPGGEVRRPHQRAGRGDTLEQRDGHQIVTLDGGQAVAGRTVVVATGARYRRLAVPRLDEFEGTSVHYAATLVEARLCRGDPVAVVGGGNSAGQAAIFLTQHAARVRLLVRGGDLRESMSRCLADRIERAAGVEALRHTEVRELLGDGTLEALVVEDNRTGTRRTVEAHALFVFIGAEPHTRWLGDQLALDDRGFILTGADARDDGRQPSLLETSQPGVFAVGDVRSGLIKRVASAVGEGAMVVRLVHDYLEVE
jgi:thioredoxin reductase (NADPH)